MAFTPIDPTKAEVRLVPGPGPGEFGLDVYIPRGAPGPSNLVVSPTDPGLTIPGMWVQTGLGPTGEDFTIWIEDGL